MTTHLWHTSGVVPCCHARPEQLPDDDVLTTIPSRVTCHPAPNYAGERGFHVKSLDSEPLMMHVPVDPKWLTALHRRQLLQAIPNRGGGTSA